MRSWWIWLKDHTTLVFEGEHLSDVAAFLRRSEIEEKDVLAVVCS